MPRIDSTFGAAPEQSDQGRRRVRNASWAVFTVFALNGFVFASWMSRLPAVRDELDLRPATIGLVLLVASLGSVGALPLTGAVVNRFGTRRTVLGAGILAAVGYAGVMGAFALGRVPRLAASLAVASVGIASWDVAMNLEGAFVEQGLGRAIMPIYHAGFSFGTVVGAGIGALMARLGVGVEAHVLGALALLVAVLVVAVRLFLPDAVTGARAAEEKAGEQAGSTGGAAASGRRSVFAAWLEPRTLLIGLLVLSAALTEGAANDWLSLASIEAFDLGHDGGALMMTVFLVAMTIMRFVGTALLDRFGRIAVLRLCIAFALVGLALFGLAPNVPVAVVGIILWGVGASLGFPVGMSAASDDPAHAAARVSVVSTIGYTAFLAGPPLLGLLAEHVGYRGALLVILVPLAISLLVVRVAAPIPGSVGAEVDPADVAAEGAHGPLPVHAPTAGAPSAVVRVPVSSTDDVVEEPGSAT